jgi:hypothetical protein
VNAMVKRKRRTKEQTMIYKTLHRKTKIAKHEHHTFLKKLNKKYPFLRVNDVFTAMFYSR